MDKTDWITDVAVAYVRGSLIPDEGMDLSLWQMPLDHMSHEEKLELISLGRAKKLALYPFKNSRTLPRVNAVMGMIRGISPSRIMDIGSGRGVFLWPLLAEFHSGEIIAADILEHRVRTMLAVRHGGFPRFYPCVMDATRMGLGDASADMVTALEVLEHIPDVDKAVGEICRLSARWIIVSVPAHRDTNPGHIHLLDEPALSAMFKNHGMTDLRFSYVLNHRICLARK